jgi:hypothetical protein
MKKMITSAFLFTALVALCLTQGRLYAMHVYGAPCGQASGFAGFLQTTHFLPAGDCSAVKGVCTNAGSKCNVSNPVSGQKKNGTCTQVQNKGGCTCI